MEESGSLRHGDSNHQNRDRCPSLQKSSCGYIKLTLVLTRESTEGVRVVKDPPFLWIADLAIIRCLFLQKSSCGYIKLISIQGCGGPWGARRREGGLVGLPFFWLCGCWLNPPDTKSSSVPLISSPPQARFLLPWSLGVTCFRVSCCQNESRANELQIFA